MNGTRFLANNTSVSMIMKLQRPWYSLGVGLLMLFLSSCMVRSTPEEVVVIPKVIHKERILIDPGHGGKDPGTLSDPKNSEKALNLIVAKELKGHLERLGYQVELTRNEDVFIPLQERARLANDRKMDLFVSMHFNHAPNPHVHGVEVFYCKKGNPARSQSSRELAYQILQKISKHTGATNRGIKEGNFVVIRDTVMPSILIEGGFLSHPKERERIENPQYRHFLTWAIACGIDAYIKQ